MPAAFTFDPNRCTGCRACELACSIENGLGPERSWRDVVTFNEAGLAGAPRFHLSLACNHCAEPACMHACPALAYSRDAGTGAVLIDPDRCIGCRYCSWACPFGAPRFEEDRGLMGKCTFCSHRLTDGLKPACATLCPTGALGFADLPAADLVARVPGFPQTELGPAIRIAEPRRHVPPAPEGAPPAILGGDGRGPEISLRSEGSLAAFTFLVALLFATLAASLAGAVHVPAYAFLVGAIVAGGLSLSHLGRPERAWRAGLNLRRSWLSREVVGFGIFAAGGTACLALGRPEALRFGEVVLAVGLLTLYAADRVYKPVYPGRHPVLDPGGALVTGLYLAGLWLASPELAAGPWLVKAVGEARELARRKGPAPLPRWLPAVHLALGLAAPAAAWIRSSGSLPGWVLVIAIGGEALARTGFYLRLRARSPARQAQLDLERQLQTRAA